MLDKNLSIRLLPRFSQRLISFQLKLGQPVEQVQPDPDQPSPQRFGECVRSPVADLAEAVKEKSVFYVYVLRSLRNNKRYVGYTAKAPSEKLKEHNSGATQWTRQNGPFVLVYQEEFGEATTARERERFLKMGKGRQWLNETLGENK